MLTLQEKIDQAEKTLNDIMKKDEEIIEAIKEVEKRVQNIISLNKKTRERSLTVDTDLQTIHDDCESLNSISSKMKRKLYHDVLSDRKQKKGGNYEQRLC